MKNALIAAGLLLPMLGAAAQAQDAYKTTPGDDRPSSETAGRDHQHVSYFNDSMDHYSVDMQIAADAYSADELILKNDKVSLSNYKKHRQQSKEQGAKHRK